MDIRTAQPENDYPKIVELVNLFEHLPISLAQFHRWDQLMPPGKSAAGWLQ